MSERFPTWVLGYPDEWTVRPGSDVRFHISGAGARTVQTQLVQLVHGDEEPSGPGFKEREVQGYSAETYPLVEQPTHHGSYGRIPTRDMPLFDTDEPRTLFALIRPSAIRSPQVVMSVWDEALDIGLALVLDGLRPTIRLGDGQTVTNIVAEDELLPHTWYALCGTWDPTDETLSVRAAPAVNSYSSRFGPACQTSVCSARGRAPSGARWPATDLLVGALDASDGRVVRGRLSGRIALPCVFNRALDAADLESLASSGAHPAIADGLIAWWDFTSGIDGLGIQGGTDHSATGTLVNAPTRAVTAHNWDGSCYEWRHAPQLYGAVHFHEDDVDDAGWSPTLTVHLDEELPSGIYALRLRAGNTEDHVPIFVGPNPSRHNDVAIVIPTASYLAYANEHNETQESAEALVGHTPTLHAMDFLLMEHREFGLSMYDQHCDGSGVSLSSRRRPIVGLRPRHRFASMAGTWQFPSDLYLIDWLYYRGESFDVLTDDDLHRDGAGALSGYTTVLTGTHPEYTSERMLDAYEHFVTTGGNVMYMGGNGFYWVVSFHSEHPWLMEVRKGENGVRAWVAEPGETSHSTTGEKGGLWRLRGRPPQKLFGTGFTAEGYGGCYPYVRLPDAYHPDVSWVFDGVGPDEVIGDFGLVGGGASGQETDRADVSLGTPPHTYLLATAHNRNDSYRVVPEDIGSLGPGLFGSENPAVRADLTLYKTAGGGSVFATSSIPWAGSLSHNGYDNSVATITGNVLDRFTRGTPAEKQQPW